MCDKLHIVFVFLSKGLMRTTVRLVDVDLQKVSKPLLGALRGKVVEHFRRTHITKHNRLELCKTQTLGCVPWQAVISAVVRY